MSFKDVLGELFYPVDGKKKKKKKDKRAPEIGYAESAADSESIAEFKGQPACFLYACSEYPELIVAGAFPLEIDEIAAYARFEALCSVTFERARETLDAKKLNLLSFRADSYARFAPINQSQAAGSADAAGEEGLTGARPVILIKKTVLAAVEARLASGETEVVGVDESAARAVSSFSIDHPAEFVVSRLFFPPRLSVSAYRFAIVPFALAVTPPKPSNARRLSFTASWSFAGQPLSTLYHVDLPPTAGAQQDNLAKAVVAGAFKDALGFWASWKRPVEKPSLAATQPGPSKGTVSICAHMHGEGLSFPCSVEFPAAYIPFIAKMAQSAPLDQSSPARLIELVRANDALFGLLQGSYRKAYLSTGSEPSLHAILSLVDDADKSIIIQNFLVPRYELKNVPLFFYYHVGQQKPDGETAYRLKPAFPIARGDIERHLSESLKSDWNHCLSTACAHRITTPEDLAEANLQAVESLARDVASGKILVSAKAAQILREDVLAPIDAVLRKEFDDNAGFQERNAPLSDLPPKTLTDMLGKFDNHVISMSCAGDEYLFGVLSKGMSRSRQTDVRVEIDLIKKRLERGDISIRQLLDARKQFVEGSQAFVDLAREGFA